MRPMVVESYLFMNFLALDHRIMILNCEGAVTVWKWSFDNSKIRSPAVQKLIIITAHEGSGRPRPQAKASLSLHGQ